MTDVSVGYNLKQIRLKRQMTQNEVARVLHVTPQAVSKWERDESLPDVTMLPDIASLYQITIDEILMPKEEQTDTDFYRLIYQISDKMDASLFNMIEEEFKKTESATELNIQLEIFMFLTKDQKDCLIEYVLRMENAGSILEEILCFVTSEHRSEIIMRILKDKDYRLLEAVIPVIPKQIRDHLIRTAITDNQYEFVEEMLPYLSREQKGVVVDCLIQYQVPEDIIESYTIFFDREQREKLIEYYYLLQNKNNQA